MSISSVQSGRHDGTATDTTPPDASATKPMGVMAATISAAVNARPRRALTRSGRTAMVGATGNDSVRASTKPSCTTRSGQVSRSNSTKRATDDSIPSGSIPRSLRADASLRRPSRCTDFMIPTGSK